MHGRNCPFGAVCLHRCTKISPRAKDTLCCSGRRSRGNGCAGGGIASPKRTDPVPLGSVAPAVSKNFVGAFGCGFVSLSFGLSCDFNNCSCSGTSCVLRSSNCSIVDGGDARRHHH